MEEKTCMEYLFHSVQGNHLNNINQDILFNASNEFRNVWNLVKKLRDLARVDVRKITRFLDAVQEGLEKKAWIAAVRQCSQAENEYRQIRRYIRPSFLDDFKVSLFIENVAPSGKFKSGTKREKKPPSSSVNVHHRPSFRNKQINKQKCIGDTGGALLKKSDFTKPDVKKNNEIINKDNKDKSNLYSNENSTDCNESSKVKKMTKDEISSGNTLKGNANSNELTESSKRKEKAADEIFSGNVLKGNENTNENTKSSKVKEKACDEIVSENTRETETIAANSDITRDASDKPNTRDGLVSDEGVSQITKTDVDCQKGEVLSNVDHSSLETESRTELKEQENTITSVSKTTDFTDETKAEYVVKSTDKGNMQQSVSFHDTDKVVDNVCVNDTQKTTMDNTENTNLGTDPNGAHSSVNKSNVQNGDLNKDDRLNDQISTDYDSNVAVKHKTCDISIILSERMTEVSYECKPEEIVTELNHVYDTEWSLAYHALTTCQPSNGMKNTIDFLGEILKLSAGDVRKTSEIKSITFPNDTVSCTVVEVLQKLKQEFLTRHLKELQKEHSIEYQIGTEQENIVNLYSAKCVELSWFMFTRRPPMVFDYDSRPMLLEDLVEIFKPYKNEGHCIHYVVWPAIRRVQGGRVVSQGIAEFR
ncbi:uncharacterized protein LOC123558968 [Mercenaria mercenaria]|uniref:uncharacterized protein LOC123558968 n=1 Tax=Mercenaria mercenaria TaxID=6596 RepID=UPI00234F565E|nr:uncharacterized protein LOC123558968 [Mercenaria mercenaria]